MPIGVDGEAIASWSLESGGASNMVVVQWKRMESVHGKNCRFLMIGFCFPQASDRPSFSPQTMAPSRGPLLHAIISSISNIDKIQRPLSTFLHSLQPSTQLQNSSAQSIESRQEQKQTTTNTKSHLENNNGGKK